MVTLNHIRDAEGHGSRSRKKDQKVRQGAGGQRKKSGCEGESASRKAWLEEGKKAVMCVKDKASSLWLLGNGHSGGQGCLKGEGGMGETTFPR